jgi:hypothetical protein
VTAISVTGLYKIQKWSYLAYIPGQIHNCPICTSATGIGMWIHLIPWDMSRFSQIAYIDASAPQFSHMLLRDNIDSLSNHFHPFGALQLLHKFRHNIQKHHK